MKGCFLLQRRFAYLGHSVACWLKEKYGVTDFCGYAYLRSSYNFLLSQKDINYSTLLLDEEVHKNYKNETIDVNYLDYLEKEFGLPHLWPYLAIDRVLMSNQLVREYPYDWPPFTHQELIKILQAHAKAIIFMLQKEKPDFVFGSVIGGLGNMLIYHIAKKMGIKTFLVLPACLYNRYIISEKYDYFTGVQEILVKGGTGASAVEQAYLFLKEFRLKPTPYSLSINNYLKSANRRSQFKFLKPQNILRSIKCFLNLLKQYREQKKDYSSDMRPLYYIIDRVKRKVRNARGLNDLYDQFNPEDNFAFFPLHYEPEISLLLQAPLYNDQINLILHLARSLPLHYKLYIKEHPAMVEFRPRNFYKALKKNPNVKIINPSVSSFSIIPKAKLIFTITGTVGWEAAMLKKPVIAFGDQFYNDLSFVKKCRDLKMLPYLVKEQLNNFQHNEEELIKFLAAIFEDSADINLQYLWEQEPDMEKKKIGALPLADLLAKKTGLSPIR